MKNKQEILILTEDEAKAVSNGQSPYDTQTFKDAYYGMMTLGGLANLVIKDEGQDIKFIISYIGREDFSKIMENIRGEKFNELNWDFPLEFIEQTFEWAKENYKRFTEEDSRT